MVRRSLTLVEFEPVLGHVVARAGSLATGPALVFSVAVELSQLYHAPWIDLIRHTTLGGLILGFGFLGSDLVCYALGVKLGVLVETIGGIVSREDGS